MQPLLHLQQLLGFLFEHAADRNAGDGRDQLGDVLLRNSHVVLAALLQPLVALLREGGALRIELGLQRGVRLPVLALGGRFGLCLQLLDLLLQPADVCRHALGVDHVLGRRLVDQVDRLVRQEAVCDVAVGQAHGSHDRLVRDRHLVVRLVARPQPLEDLDRLFLRRLVDVDGREAPLQRRVLLDVPAVLVQRRRADDVQLAARQRRLEHRRGVDRAFRAARADDLVDLVDEDDHLALRRLDLVHYRLQPLLELAAELRAGHHRPHVQRHHALALEVLRHVAGHDALGQRLGDRGLADAGLADDHRVVLRAPVENLHQAPHLVVAADHGVELVLARRLRQVDRVLLQRVVLGLGRRAIGARAAADLLQHLVEPLFLDPELLEDARRVALALVRHRDQDVLDADVVVLQPLGLGVRRLQQAHDARRRVDLHDVVRELRRRLQRAADGLPQLRAVDSQLLEDLGRDPLVVVHQRHQDVLHVPLRVPVTPHHLLRRRQHLLRPLCKPVLSHHDRVSSSSSWIVPFPSDGDSVSSPIHFPSSLIGYPAARTLPIA